MLLLAAWHVFWAPFQLLGITLDLILESLGMPWAWPGSWDGPGTSEWAGLLPSLGGCTVLLGPGIHAPGKVGDELGLMGPTIK